MGKQISWAKVVFNTILLTGIITSCNIIAGDVEKAGVQTTTTSAAQIAMVSERSFDTEKQTEYAVPYGDTAFKSYMSFRAITNTQSAQYRLQQKCWTDDEGLRRLGDDYVVALGTYYADHVGQRFEIELSSGTSFTAVVGDIKSNRDTDSTHKYTAMSGGRKNVVEFVVDTKKLNSKARKMGDISYISGFSGNIRSIKEKGSMD